MNCMKQRGSLTLEYIILSAFTAIASVVAISFMKTAIEKRMQDMSNKLDIEIDSTTSFNVNP